MFFPTNQENKFIPESFHILNVITSPNVMKLVNASVMAQSQGDPGLLLILMLCSGRNSRNMKNRKDKNLPGVFQCMGDTTIRAKLLGVSTFLKPIWYFKLVPERCTNTPRGMFCEEESTWLKKPPKAPGVQEAYPEQHSFCPHPKYHTLRDVKPLVFIRRIIYCSPHTQLKPNWASRPQD